MAVPAVFLAAAGAAALMYYTGFREPRLRKKRTLGLASDSNEVEVSSPKRPRRALLQPGTRLARLFAEQIPERPPSTCMEAAATMANSIRMFARETLFKWPLADLFFGLAFVWRRRKLSEVGRVYAEDESSVQLTLDTNRVLELQMLKRLVSMCYCFARKKREDLLRDFGYKPEDIVMYEPKSKLLAPAFAVIADHANQWILVLVRGTHSAKDRLTCATCVGVPFHHSVLAEPEWDQGNEEDDEDEDDAGGVCMLCGVLRKHHAHAPSKAGQEQGLNCFSMCRYKEAALVRAEEDADAEGLSGSSLQGSRSRSRGGRGVKQIVLGYAHCGMVAAARAMAQRITGLLQSALQKHPGYTVKLVGHSLGGATASLLTFILREKEGLEDTSCITFGPAAAMTWDLAQSGECCVTTIINEADFVPTFSASSLDDLRTEVRRSAWANDLHEQLRKTRALRIILQTVGVLRRQLGVLRASTVAMSTRASRHLYARLQTAGTAKGIFMALRGGPAGRKGFLCFPAKRITSAGGAGAALGTAAGGADSGLEGIAIGRRPVLRFFQRACLAVPLLLLRGAKGCPSCCPPLLPLPPGVPPIPTPGFCGRCRVRSAMPLLALAGFRRQSAATAATGPLAPATAGGAVGQGGGLEPNLHGTGYSSEEMDESTPLKAVDASGHMRMCRDDIDLDASKKNEGLLNQLSLSEAARQQKSERAAETMEGVEPFRAHQHGGLARAGTPEGSVRRRVGKGDTEQPSTAAGPDSPGRRVELTLDSWEGAEEEMEDSKDDEAAGLAALLEAMEQDGEDGEEGVGALPVVAEASPREEPGHTPTWQEMEEKLRDRALTDGEAEMTEEEASVVEGILREEEALEEALAEEREEARRSLTREGEEASPDREGTEEEGLLLSAEQEENEEDDTEEDDDEIRDPRRWYPCGRVVHLVWNTWTLREDGSPAVGSGGTAECACPGVGGHGICNSGVRDIDDDDDGRWRVGMFEVDRRLYGKIRLSGTMVADHLMGNYAKSFQGLVEEAERELKLASQVPAGELVSDCNKEMQCTIDCT